MTVILEPPVQNWYCPNCGLRDETREFKPHTRFHICPRLRYLTAPMLPAGTKAKVEAKDREDYTNGDVMPVDGEGKVVMSVVTTRDDGTDVAVFAPLATGGFR